MKAAKQFRPRGVRPSTGAKSIATQARCKRYHTREWERTRQRIFARDGMVCQMPGCGRLCIGKGQAHCDHVIAVVNGGTDDDSNLRTLCQTCHNRRTRMDQMTHHGGGQNLGGLRSLGTALPSDSQFGKTEEF